MAFNPDQLIIEIKLRDATGRVHAVVCEEVLSDVAYRGPRIGGDMRAGFHLFGSTEPMRDAVKILQVQEIRRKLFRDMFPRMAERLADFLYDREGWSDPSRQEKVERIARDAEK